MVVQYKFVVILGNLNLENSLLQNNLFALEKHASVDVASCMLL